MLNPTDVVGHLKSADVALLNTVKRNFAVEILPFRLFLQLKVIIENVDRSA